MSFKILLLAPDADPSWPEKIRRAVPGVVVNAYNDPQDALDDIADADAAYGTVPPELLAPPPYRPLKTGNPLFPLGITLRPFRLCPLMREI
jgi:hypothetical protein